MGRMCGVERGVDGFEAGWVWGRIGFVGKSKSKNQNEKLRSKYQRAGRGWGMVRRTCRTGGIFHDERGRSGAMQTLTSRSGARKALDIKELMEIVPDTFNFPGHL